MGCRSVKLLPSLLLLISLAYINQAFAVVAQSGSAALRSDIFVNDSKKSSDVERRKRERATAKQKAEEKKAAEEKAKIEKKRQELLKTKRTLQDLEDFDCPNRQVQVYQGDKLVETYTKSNVAAKKREIENELKRLDALGPKKATSTAETSDTANPEAGANYAKHYASKLFQTYSGHITVEQQNIPRKIAVSKGSTMQFNLNEMADTIWNIELNEKVAKIKSNTVQGDKRIVILETLNNGNSKLLFDQISVKPNNYKVLTRKRMLLIVD